MMVHGIFGGQIPHWQAVMNLDELQVGMVEYGFFGLASPLPVYLDVSLKIYKEVIPAAGSVNSAVRISPEKMADMTQAEWVDVCQSLCGPELLRPQKLTSWAC